MTTPEPERQEAVGTRYENFRLFSAESANYTAATLLRGARVLTLAVGIPLTIIGIFTAAPAIFFGVGTGVLTWAETQGIRHFDRKVTAARTLRRGR